MANVETITIQQGKGRTKVTLIVHTTGGNGFSGFLFGGETPHVGGTAYSVPRYDRDKSHLTADISTICGPGHRDILAAQKAASIISIGTGQCTCITAGIHTDMATSDEINTLMDNCAKAADRFVEEIKGSQNND